MHRVDYNALAAAYAQHRGVNPEVLVRLSRTLSRDSRVLEVGSGTGNYIGEIEKLHGCRCVGVDPSLEMLTRARSRGGTVTYHQGPAEDLSLPDAEFDLVFSVDVVHHMTDRRRAFREAFRVLRPGGKLCTVTDSEWVIRHREPLSVYFPETVNVELARYPRIDVLTRDLASVGFSSIVDELAEFSYELTSAAPYRARVFSSLLFIDDDAFQRGLARLDAALQKGPVPCTSRYTLVWAEA